MGKGKRIRAQRQAGLRPDASGELLHREMVEASYHLFACVQCGAEWAQQVPILAFHASGPAVTEGAPGSLTIAAPCPRCGTSTTSRSVPAQAIDANGDHVTAVNVGALRAHLELVRRDAEAGRLDAQQVAESLESAPWSRRVGEWLNKNNANLSLAISALSLLIAALTLLQGNGTDGLSADEVERIISGVIEELERTPAP